MGFAQSSGFVFVKRFRGITVNVLSLQPACRLIGL